MPQKLGLEGARNIILQEVLLLRDKSLQYKTTSLGDQIRSEAMSDHSCLGD